MTVVRGFFIWNTCKWDAEAWPLRWLLNKEFKRGSTIVGLLNSDRSIPLLL